MESSTKTYVQTLLLLMDGGHRLCLEFLIQQHPKLDEYLVRNEVYTKGKNLKERGLISDEQFDLLYPPTNLDEWDFGLTTRFLQYCSDIGPSEQGLLDAIQSKRREITERFPQSRMTQDEFTEIWEDLIVTIENGIDMLTDQDSKQKVLDTIGHVKQLTITADHVEKVRWWNETEQAFKDKRTEGKEGPVDDSRKICSIVHDSAFDGKLETLKYIARTNPERLQETNEENSQAIHFAAAGGQLHCLKYLIEQGVKHYSRDSTSGDTILFKAIKSRNVDVVKFICENYGRLINQPCRVSGCLPITSAIDAPEEIVRCLVAKGVNLKARYDKDNTIFHEAASKGVIGFIRVVCDESKDRKMIKELVNGRDVNGRTLCHSAAGAGQLDCLKAMEMDGFDIIKPSDDGFTVLNSAAIKGQLHVVKYLCKTYPQLTNKINRKGENVLHSAALGGNVEIFRYLLALGVGLEVRDNERRTVFHRAAYAGSIAIIKALCEMEDDTIQSLKHATDTAGRTPCHSAASAGHIDCLKALVELGFDPLLNSNDGFTLIDSAAKNGHLSCITYVCETYPELISVINKKETNALFSAALGGNVDCLKYLEEKGMQDPSKYGSTILHKGAYGGGLELVRYLCEKDRFLKSMKTPKEETVLFSAVRGGHLEVLKYLLSQSVDPNLRDTYGNTILHVAAKTDKADIVQYLCAECPQLKKVKDNRGTMAVDFAVDDCRKILSKK